ncbi:MAG: von Willebrand factor type A domain-containing protein, partial [Verrucomicrobiales bacterium]|nr:von Willebrand factor type A domain-containing protein [Verrucomicrobiales bacterium]
PTTAPVKPAPRPTPQLTETQTADSPFSTFSLHVGDASFQLARASLAKNEWPEAGRIRIEEFVNAFDYGDPVPSGEEKVSAQIEQAAHPFLQQRNLLRLSMRTATAGRGAGTPLRLTFLLDNSGSMEREDRRETVRRAFAILAGLMQPEDRVTLISFARQPRLLADKIAGDQTGNLVERIRNLPSEGGTNLESALQLAFEKAKEQQLDTAQNRIVLLTDGAANLGDANPESLARRIETMREAGIAFDAAGVGTEGLNDEILEALTRKGDGRYYLLAAPEDADAGFAEKIAGAFRPAAKNVKVQVEFNPKRVPRYQLLGFDKHRLKKEDFRNDKVDAAELAAEEAGVAVYHFEADPQGSGDVGFVSVRFRDMSTGRMVERKWTIPYQRDAKALIDASPSLKLASASALFAAKLEGGPLGDVVEMEELTTILGGLPGAWQNREKVAALRSMLDTARELEGK